MEDRVIDVLGLGAVSIDFVGEVDNWPAEGTKMPLKGFSISDGGLVGTALVAVSRLGGKAAYVGKLGNSETAKRAIQALCNDGVDTSLVINQKDAEPIRSVVLTNSRNGKRNIFWTSKSVQYPVPSEFLLKNWYKKIKILLIDHTSGYAGIETAKIAQQHGVPVVIDVERNENHLQELMSFCSHIVVSEDFAADYTEKKKLTDMLNALHISQHQAVIITRGENGCIGLYDEGTFELPAFKVEVVDTTGCGDVFHGAYALAIARGQRVPAAAKFASAAAALCATRIGGRDGIPTRNELESFLKSRK